MLFDYNELLHVLFLISVHDSMLVLELLYEQSIIFLSYKLHASLLHFLISILSHKNGKLLCKLCKSLVHSTSTSGIYPLLLSSSYFFYELVIKFR